MNLLDEKKISTNLNIIGYIAIALIVIFFMYHAGKAVGKFIYFLQN